MKTRTYIELGLVVVILILILLLNRTCKNVSEKEHIINNLSDALTTKTNKLGQQTATIQVLTLQNEKDFLKLKTNDSTILWLQKTVEDYKGKLHGATVVSNATTSSGSTETIIIQDHYDTIVKDSIVYLYPQYTTNWSNKWEEGYIKATKDSIFRDIKIINELEITIGKERLGFFKGTQTNVNIKNLNPNTKTTELRSLDFVSKDKLINFGIQGGYGYTFNSKSMQPYVGFGIQFNFRR